MFTLLRPDPLDLTIRDYNSYHYLRRHQLRAAFQDYGPLGFLAAMEDLIVLQVLVEAQIDDHYNGETFGARSPLRLGSAVPSAHFSAAASVMTLSLLSRAKKRGALNSLPHIEERVGIYTIAARVCSQRARRILRELRFDESFLDACDVENVAISDVGSACESPVVKLVGELFAFTAILAHKHTNLDTARLLGESVGRFMCGYALTDGRGRVTQEGNELMRYAKTA